MAHAPAVDNKKVLDLPPLPGVPWGAIGQQAPERIVLGARDDKDPLPNADIVVLTWTSAEWSALDQVFLGGDQPRADDDYDWRDGWKQYARSVGAYTADPKSGPLWGRFAMVRVFDRSGRPWRVLLFKCNAHLAHPPWIDGLSAMIWLILADTKCDRIYSIGTAGGSVASERLGDAVITNAAQLDLQRPENMADPDNGRSFRCPTWYPDTSLSSDVERHLLFKLSDIVTWSALEALFAELKSTHPTDPGLDSLRLRDLVNEPLDPDNLGSPQVRARRDVPLLTTDFYYIARGVEAAAWSFLEMDDAVIAREAQALGVRYAFIRNISDPLVRARSDEGRPISEPVRSDWSGLIYKHFGFYTSYNGALATWATIAGQGAAAYTPRRRKEPEVRKESAEVGLVYGVRACGSCAFFWPEDIKQRPYGPYTAWDVDTDTPYSGNPDGTVEGSPWVLGRTAPPAFPNPAVATGCRKAPIMTIGINPNLTAFSPGTNGTSWAYPHFSSAGGTDAWTKYAWYYRYRTEAQERLDLDFVRQFLLPEGQVVAERAGAVVKASRPTDSPAWTLTVRYDGDPTDTDIAIPGVLGDFPYGLLVDQSGTRSQFAAGDVLAARIAVPEGIQTTVYRERQTYYHQFVPVLDELATHIASATGASPALKMGEDVVQLDMVACASPHWNKDFLGGSQEAIDTIVQNCTKSNAWAWKQLVQTRPVVLYVVSKSSWDMFRKTYGPAVKLSRELPEHPVDNDFTLLAATTDLTNPVTLSIDTEVDGVRWQLTTRLVITPHFSYDDNFLPQYRVPDATWTALDPAAVAWMQADPRFTFAERDPKYPHDPWIIRLATDTAASARADLAARYPATATTLDACFYDAHASMAAVLDQLYDQGQLAWHTTDKAAWLARAEGGCRFCVNDRWQFPGGCPYGKPDEESMSASFAEKLARKVVDG